MATSAPLRPLTAWTVDPSGLTCTVSGLFAPSIVGSTRLVSASIELRAPQWFWCVKLLADGEVGAFVTSWSE